jgi:hypothetical protein
MPILDLPTPGVTPGPIWAQKVNAALEAINTAVGSGGGGTAPDATTTTKGIIQLAGHLYGTAAAPFVRGATETQTGIVEMATAAETTTGTDTARAVHPAGLKVELDKKANLASPTLTGTPAAPTASAGTNTTQIATTAFVQTALGRYSAVNAQTGTSYAPVLTDPGKLVTLNNAAAITVTMPSDATTAFPVGSQIDFAVIGNGMATFVAGSGATVKATPSAVTRANGSAVSAIKYAANTWLIVGDLA